LLTLAADSIPNNGNATRGIKLVAAMGIAWLSHKTAISAVTAANRWATGFMPSGVGANKIRKKSANPISWLIKTCDPGAGD
jgi:hypothetical protein